MDRGLVPLPQLRITLESHHPPDSELSMSLTEAFVETASQSNSFAFPQQESILRTLSRKIPASKFPKKSLIPGDPDLEQPEIISAASLPFTHPHKINHALNQNLSLVDRNFGTSLECTDVLPLHSDDLFPVMPWTFDTAS